MGFPTRDRYGVRIFVDSSYYFRLAGIWPRRQHVKARGSIRDLKRAADGNFPTQKSGEYSQL